MKKKPTCACGSMLPHHLAALGLTAHVCTCHRRYKLEGGVFVEDGTETNPIAGWLPEANAWLRDLAPTMVSSVITRTVRNRTVTVFSVAVVRGADNSEKLLWQQQVGADQDQEPTARAMSEASEVAFAAAFGNRR